MARNNAWTTTMWWPTLSARVPAITYALCPDTTHRDEDILVPNTLALSSWRNLVYFPYDKKIKRAIFRGRGGHPRVRG